MLAVGYLLSALPGANSSTSAMLKFLTFAFLFAFAAAADNQEPIQANAVQNGNWLQYANPFGSNAADRHRGSLMPIIFCMPENIASTKSFGYRYASKAMKFELKRKSGALLPKPVTMSFRKGVYVAPACAPNPKEPFQLAYEMKYTVVPQKSKINVPVPDNDIFQMKITVDNDAQQQSIAAVCFRMRLSIPKDIPGGEYRIEAFGDGTLIEAGHYFTISAGDDNFAQNGRSAGVYGTNDYLPTDNSRPHQTEHRSWELRALRPAKTSRTPFDINLKTKIWPKDSLPYEIIESRQKHTLPIEVILQYTIPPGGQLPTFSHYLFLSKITVEPGHHNTRPFTLGEITLRIFEDMVMDAKGVELIEDENIRCEQTKQPNEMVVNGRRVVTRTYLVSIDWYMRTIVGLTMEKPLKFRVDTDMITSAGSIPLGFSESAQFSYSPCEKDAVERNLEGIY